MHSKPKDSKISLYETLKQVERSTGKTPPYLSLAPKLKPECMGLWDVFGKLGDTSYAEIQAYSSLTGEPLGQWEIEALVSLGSIRQIKREWKPNG